MRRMRFINAASPRPDAALRRHGDGHIDRRFFEEADFEVCRFVDHFAVHFNHAVADAEFTSRQLMTRLMLMR